MTNSAAIHREIQIDCGHRVPDHTSKCRSPHGHRYRIIATCYGDVLEQQGEHEHGMVIDFGYIKKFMMDVLDAVFDHAFVVSKHDVVMMGMFFPDGELEDIFAQHAAAFSDQMDAYCAALQNNTKTKPLDLPRTLVSDQDPDGMKIVPVSYTPTAENMAKHMFDLLNQVVSCSDRSTQIRLANLRLYETPNCFVDYPGTAYSGMA